MSALRASGRDGRRSTRRSFCCSRGSVTPAYVQAIPLDVVRLAPAVVLHQQAERQGADLLVVCSWSLSAPVARCSATTRRAGAERRALARLLFVRRGYVRTTPLHRQGRSRLRRFAAKRDRGARGCEGTGRADGGDDERRRGRFETFDGRRWDRCSTPSRAETSTRSSGKRKAAWRSCPMWRVTRCTASRARSGRLWNEVDILGVGSRGEEPRQAPAWSGAPATTWSATRLHMPAPPRVATQYRP